MARLLWLADCLRAAGLTVHEYPGWRTRGADTFGPVSGIVCHGTGGSSTSTDAAELRVLAETGSTSAPEVPIAQLYLSRSGAVWVVASGTATGVKAGEAGPLKGLSDDAVLQIEAQHADDESWTDRQYWAYVRLVAALVAYREPGYAVTVDRVVGHGEHQPSTKTDPWFDMNVFRRNVLAVLNGGDDSMLIKVKGRPEVWVSDGHARRHLTSPAALAAAQAAGQRLIEVATAADLDALGGPVHAPATVQLSEADRAAIVAGLTAALPTAADLEAASERAVRRVLGAVDGATPAT